VPFLETVIAEPVALAVSGKQAPPGHVSVELGAGESARESVVLTGALLESALYTPAELARVLHLDGFGAYLFLKHGGVSAEVAGRSMITGGTLATRADLNRLALPDPDDPAIYEPYRRFIAENRAEGKALFCFLNIGSDPVILGMGFERFALALYDDRALVEDLFSLYTTWMARAAAHLSELDFDFLWFGDDIAFKTQPYVSPRVFRQLFMPHFRRVIDNVRKPWIFHSDGNLLPILDDLLTLGMNGLHPIEPEAMDLAFLKRRYGGRVCLVGNVSVDTLARGCPADVTALVRRAISTAAPGGGYIAGSSNSIPDYCRPENVLAMRDAILRYGTGESE
jgi:hypothetical protein